MATEQIPVIELRQLLQEAHSHAQNEIEACQRYWFANRDDASIRRIYRLCYRANELRRAIIRFNDEHGIRYGGKKADQEHIDACWPMLNAELVASPATIIKIGEACKWPKS